MASKKQITYTVNEATGCWECDSHKPDSYGYAVIRVNGKRIKLHRHMYETHKETIPDGLLIRHTCDNRICINPDHLLIGTVADNVNDCIERGRHIIKMSGRKGNVANLIYGPQKLTAEKVAEIRTSTLSDRILAEAYSVCRGTIHAIKCRKIWKNV
jgi:hypothetical protein